MAYNVVIPYEDIIELIKEQFANIKENPSEGFDYSSINFVVSNEQMFMRIKDKKPNMIYIVVRFSSAAINFGQATLPLELSVLGEANNIKTTQDFLNDFVSRYNLNSADNITQLYMTPRAALNFNETYNEFRTLFSVTGTWVIGDNTIRMAELAYYPLGGVSGEKPEIIPVIAYNDSTENSLNPQPYPNTNGRTKSYGSFQTFAFSIVLYPDGSKKLIQKLFKLKFGTSSSHQNDSFVFQLKFDNMDLDFENTNTHTPVNTTAKWTYKCKNVDFTQKIGEIPVLNSTFTL